MLWGVLLCTRDFGLSFMFGPPWHLAQDLLLRSAEVRCSWRRQSSSLRNQAQWEASCPPSGNLYVLACEEPEPQCGQWEWSDEARPRGS